MSEYDCGPTSMLNAVSYLFEREAVPPELIRNIMLFTLDVYNDAGDFGRSGTSPAAMAFLSNWLSCFGRVGKLPVSSRYLSGDSVFFGPTSLINDALKRRGAVVLRLFLEGAHYVALTGISDEGVQVFDPYFGYRTPDQRVKYVGDRPWACNRVIPLEVFDSEGTADYNLGPMEGREAVLIFNNNTMLTEEDTVEYII